MPELPVVAVIVAKPGSEQTVRDAFTSGLSATRAEAGCLKYDLLESTDSPGTFVTVELWRERADLDNHLAGEGIKALTATLADHLAVAPMIHPLNPIDVA